MAASFDTLTYAKKLKAAGFTEQQAEAQADALLGVIDENLATKADVIALRRDVKELEQRITIRLGGLIVAATAVLAVWMKLP